MVVTAQHLASEVGAEILREGGNAADAAVAVGYAMAVVYPAAASLGGGGFATIYDPQNATQKASFVDYRERAPLKATEKMYLDAQGHPSKTDSKTGWKAVATPGVVAGLEEIRQKWGTLSREKLMAPAIKLAQDGFILEQGDIDLLNTSQPFFRKNKEAKGVFTNADGKDLKVGDRQVQHQLAKTLRLISNQGKEGFYKGSVAKEMTSVRQNPNEILSEKDLAAYKVREFNPLQCAYHGYEIYTAPLPSAGGVALCEILGVLEHYNLRKMGFQSEAAYQVQIEAMRRAYWDRRLLGDGVSPKIIDHFLDFKYQEKIAETLPKEAPKDPKNLEDPFSEKHETTHYSIIDRNGMAVSITCTMDGWFGAGVLAGKTGVWMNDEMDDFSLKAGAPNMFGIPGAKANAIAPGKTPLSSMSPTIVTTSKGQVFMVTGSPGGSRIPTITLSVLTGVLDGHMNVAKAVKRPRFHEQWAPSVVEVEPKAVPSSVQHALGKKGYHFVERHPWGMAGSIVVSQQRKDSRKVFGAADPRRLGGSTVSE
ncbi:gamma-glutamyltranspeptidase [Lasius niger]|uniref:Gamma-glutamyltranspeptidase n=1 Tax=Lasius niger TaxID=67767 RepID=A0A0J7KN74_LASNI|nr:gamma-glutamyltranspeptidase [Lasius niger]